MVKEYKLSKTAAKTARDNSLRISEKDSKLLFDFSSLEDIQIPDDEKEIIMQDALRNGFRYENEHYHMAEIDRYRICNGISCYYKHKVYRKDGKFLYMIQQFAKLIHHSGHRHSIYDRYYEDTETRYISQYSEPMNDIEI